MSDTTEKAENMRDETKAAETPDLREWLRTWREDVNEPVRCPVCQYLHCLCYMERVDRFD